MSNLFFPVTANGSPIPWVVKSRAPKWNTQVQESMGGGQFRVARWANPRWSWKLSLPFQKNASVLDHWKTVVGFLMQMQGGADSFLFCPPEDANTISNQFKGGFSRLTGVQIGVGDGVQKVFPLVRPFGTATWPYGKACEPVQWVDTRGTALVPAFKVNGVTQGTATFATTDGATGGVLVTFTTAPSAGLAVTADFDFAYRVRVTNDVSFDVLAWQMWEGAELELEQVLQ